jgi:predicted protein tyrosine phosphatase
MSGTVANKVAPGLWIGSIQSLCELPKLSSHSESPTTTSWTVISVVSAKQLVRFVRVVVAMLQSRHAGLIRQHVMWELEDQESAPFLSPRLSDILTVMHEARATPSACLVHCARGISRSAAVAAAYFLSLPSDPMTLAPALNQIRLARPTIKPNRGFLIALQKLEAYRGDVFQAIQAVSIENDDPG